MKKTVTQDILRLHDEFEGDIGLVSERWVSEKKREEVRIHLSALQLLGEYVDQLYFVKVKFLSADLKSRTASKITELERDIEDNVIDVMRKRVG